MSKNPELPENRPELVPPNGWQQVQTWLKTLYRIDDNDKTVVCEPLMENPDSENFMRRFGNFSSLRMWTKSWESFSNYFDDEKRAGDVVDLLSGQKIDETNKIRAVDALFEIETPRGLTNISNLITWNPIRPDDFDGEFSDNDWKCLMSELSNPNSELLSDREMEKLSQTPRDGDAIKRPLRYLVASQWSGRAEVPETKGDFAKSLQYCKDKFIK
jgi:hypothetical protein